VLKTQICVTRPQCVKVGFKEIGQEGVDSTDLVQDKDKWRAVVNAVMKFCFHKMRGIFFFFD